MYCSSKAIIDGRKTVTEPRTLPGAMEASKEIGSRFIVRYKEKTAITEVMALIITKHLNRLVAEAAVKTISDIDVLNSFLTALNLARDTKQEPSVPEGWRERAQECVTGFYASSERYQTDSYGGVAIEILRVMLEKQL